SEDIIRVRLAPEGSFLVDFSYAINFKQENYVSYELIEDEDYYKLKTSTVVCLIRKRDFNIAFADADEKVINQDHAAMHWEENVDFGGYYVYCTKQAAADEAFFGLGDKATNLNLRGRRVKNWNSDTYSYAFNQDPLYKTIPFYMGVTEGQAY